jgi:hypothetical protein
VYSDNEQPRLWICPAHVQRWWVALPTYARTSPHLDLSSTPDPVYSDDDLPPQQSATTISFTYIYIYIFSFISLSFGKCLWAFLVNSNLFFFFSYLLFFSVFISCNFFFLICLDEKIAFQKYWIGDYSTNLTKNWLSYTPNLGLVTIFTNPPLHPKHTPRHTLFASLITCVAHIRQIHTASRIGYVSDTDSCTKHIRYSSWHIGVSQHIWLVISIRIRIPHTQPHKRCHKKSHKFSKIYSKSIPAPWLACSPHWRTTTASTCCLCYATFRVLYITSKCFCFNYFIMLLFFFIFILYIINSLYITTTVS